MGARIASLAVIVAVTVSPGFANEPAALLDESDTAVNVGATSSNTIALLSVTPTTCTKAFPARSTASIVKLTAPGLSVTSAVYVQVHVTLYSV